MKKKLFLNWMILFLTIWILYSGMTFLIRMVLGRDIDFSETIITGFFFSFLFMVFQILTIYFTLHRAKYLEINSSEKPSFKVACSSVIDLPQNLDFTCLKNEIANKWLITFSNDISHVLKFRTRFNFFRNMFGTGPAAWLKFDGESGKVQLECFSMSGVNNDLARKMQKEIEKCLNSTCNVSEYSNH